jgi:hypothetical protein
MLQSGQRSTRLWPVSVSVTTVANFNQPPRYMPEKGRCSMDTDMLQLQVGGWQATPALQLSTASKHAKEERWKRKKQRGAKTTTGRMFSSGHTAPGLSYAATQKQKQYSRPQLHRSAPSLLRHNQQVRSQSLKARNGNSSSLNDMLKRMRNCISADHDTAERGRIREQ